ncbi:MAG: FecR domain-containing protein [Opitutae bacterium]|nr:FecR domain-containing protein [Opitutae bacterium]
MSKPAPNIEDTAAEWLGASEGGLTSAQAAELDAWLRADPRHAAAYAQLQATSRALDRLAELRPAGGEPDPDLPLRPRARKLAWFPVALAAAAAVAVAYVGWWRTPAAPAAFAQTAVTAVGQWREMNLPDGSRIALNTDSAVAVNYTATERQVQLTRGEALFTVAKNPARPFVVNAAGVAVRAVGTAFDVRLRAEAVEVLVTEGRVRVDDAPRGRSLLPATTADTPLLEAGQRVVIATSRATESAPAPAAAVAPVAASETARRLAWQQRRLEFDPERLQTVVEEFNRYNRHKLVVADAETGALLVGGSFLADDTATFVHLLETGFGVTAERREQETILRRAK